MSFIYDYLLVQVEKVYEDTVSAAGLELTIGTVDQSKVREDGSVSYSANSRRRIYGTVIAVPTACSDTLIKFEDKGFPEPTSGVGHDELMAMGAASWDLDKVRRFYNPTSYEPTPITMRRYQPDLSLIAEGDKVYFHKLATNEDMMVEEGMYMIRIDEIICSISKLNGAMTMISGHILIEPCVVTENESRTSTGLYTQVGDKRKWLEAFVYAGYGSVQPGAKICYIEDADWDNKIEGKDYCVCREDEILAELE